MGVHNSLAPALLDLVRCLLEDIAMSVSPPGLRKSFQRDMKTVRSRVSSEGISFLTKSLPRFAKHLDSSLEFGCWKPIHGFRRGSASLPLFLGGLTRLVFRSDGSLRSDPSADAILAIRQIGYAFYKLEAPISDDMVSSAEESYVKVDSGLPAADTAVGSFPLRTRVLLRGAAQVMQHLFADFNERDILPRHGPGSVATGESREKKWDFKRLYKPLHEVYPYYEYFVSSRSHFLDSGRNWWFSLKREPYGVSKYTLVPKDSRGPRGISMEPLEFQFVQQGLFRSLKKWIERHPVTRGRVNFTSQEVNQALALSSSIDGRFATVDMKDASDRVSTWLVRQIFADCPGLLRALMATRSSSTLLPSGRTLVLNKFAPQGSALCFPIEACVFYALLVSSRMLDEGLNVRKACRDIYVYGDDIICHPNVYEAAARDWPVLGLRFNAGKSFSRGSFRESCGVDAYAGVNVTPLRFRRVLTQEGKVGPEQALSLLALRNSFYERGFFKTSECIDRILKTRLGNLPIVPVGSTWGGLALVSWDVASVHPNGCRTRYNAHLQKREVSAFRAIALSRPSRFREWHGVQQFLCNGGVPDQLPCGTSRRAIISLKKRWIDCS